MKFFKLFVFIGFLWGVCSVIIVVDVLQSETRFKNIEDIQQSRYKVVSNRVERLEQDFQKSIQLCMELETKLNALEQQIGTQTVLFKDIPILDLKAPKVPDEIQIK